MSATPMASVNIRLRALAGYVAPWMTAILGSLQCQAPMASVNITWAVHNVWCVVAWGTLMKSTTLCTNILSTYKGISDAEPGEIVNCTHTFWIFGSISKHTQIHLDQHDLITFSPVSMSRTVIAFSIKHDRISLLAPVFTSLPVRSKKNHDDVIKWKHFPRCWPFVRRIHRSPVNSPHKSQ